MDSASKKKVLFVGESITDVYHYGRLIGRPPKEPIICIEHTDTTVFQGGVFAAAGHARDFVKEVDIVSSVEIRKERWLEQNRYRKLFEVYGGYTKTDIAWPDLSQYDAVIVTDYGHGMMTPEVIDKLCDESRYLAVNVQTNASNYGFSLATKYPKADYLCMDELEARLATGNQAGWIIESFEKLRKIASTVAITLGKQGAVGTSKEGTFWAAAVSDKVLDTMGAGDAFFAVTACFAQEAPMPHLLDIGNAAGALKVKSVGQKPITKDDLRRLLNS